MSNPKNRPERVEKATYRKVQAGQMQQELTMILHEFSEGYPPAAISVTQLIMNCNTMEAQTTGERPHSRTKWLTTGSMVTSGMKQSMHVKKNPFNLSRRSSSGKTDPCTATSSGSKIPRHDPIVAGDMPSSRRRTGVAKKRG